MQANLDAALDFIVHDEGPELNISAGEPGGASRYGISLLALSEDCARLMLPAPTIDTLRDMSIGGAKEFYSHKAKVVRFVDLSSGVDYVVLNSCVTIGPTGSALIAQMAVDMWPATRIFDDATIALINETKPEIVIHAMCSAWLAWKARSGPDDFKSWDKYNHGWTNRDRVVRKRALALAGIK